MGNILYMDALGASRRKREVIEMRRLKTESIGLAWTQA